MSLAAIGDHTELQYSKTGRTYVIKKRSIVEGLREMKDLKKIAQRERALDVMIEICWEKDRDRSMVIPRSEMKGGEGMGEPKMK